ncbi:MAG: MucB/RseB C-terminal domain-containing protein [Gammaproteobacteria bacterium]|nr:MucB/RseB C-terminal domain-containing protein [Gammaproteobacteria bacterium]MDD9851395.1 MucB/RseB C-terminal domain-containing protein [Gammaproteobacteria bacterium]MDD9870055.1 MucB/RseB C-terminal domain-containing protein [Gammaproteobacteria bacterium]
MKKSSLFFCAALFLCAPPAAGGDAMDWLMRINHAARNLDYRGVFVYAHGAQMETIQIFHRASGGAVKERLFSLNGKPRELIRDSENVWCYLPGRKIGFKHYRQAAEESFPALPGGDLARIEKFYTVTEAGHSRVAGRKVHRIAITPKDVYRYGYQLWPDAASGLLLRMDVTGADGRALEKYMFTDINTDAAITDADLAPGSGGDLVWVESGRRAAGGDAGAMRWTVGAMPPGFTVTRRLRRNAPGNAAAMSHLVLGDGMAAVSIFIQPAATADNPLRGLHPMGAVHAFGRTVGDHHVTVIGEVPAATVKMVGDSVH